MGIFTKTFKSGNSEAVRLPKKYGFGPGTEVEIQREGDMVIIRPRLTEAEQLVRFKEGLKALSSLPKPSDIGQRLTVDWPDRAE